MTTLPSRQQDGFKAHIVFEPDTELITAGDRRRRPGRRTATARLGRGCNPADPSLTADGVHILADFTYGTGDMLAAIADTGHTAVVKPCVDANRK